MNNEDIADQSRKSSKSVKRPIDSPEISSTHRKLKLNKNSNGSLNLGNQKSVIQKLETAHHNLTQEEIQQHAFIGNVDQTQDKGEHSSVGKLFTNVERNVDYINVTQQENVEQVAKVQYEVPSTTFTESPTIVGRLHYFKNETVSFMGYKCYCGYFGDKPQNGLVVLKFDKDELDVEKFCAYTGKLNWIFPDNILKVEYKVDEDDKVFIAFKYDKTNTPWILSDLKNRTEVIEKKKICHGIAEGLKVLHVNGVILDSLKPENVLIYKGNLPMIINMSFITPKKIFPIIYYTSHANDTKSKAANVLDLARVIKFVHSGGKTTNFDNKLDLASDLIRKLEMSNPDDRPTIATVLRAPYFKSFDHTMDLLKTIQLNNDDTTNLEFIQLKIDFEKEALRTFGNPENVKEFISSALDSVLVGNLMKRPKSITSFSGLILVIRNKYEHRLDTDFKECLKILGNSSEEHIRYWDKRFPGLFSIVYKHFGHL